MKVVRPLAVLAATVLTGSLLAACGAEDTGYDTTVTTGFYPLQWATEQVAGDHWTVQNLTGPGVEPHDLELSVQQTLAVSESALVVLEKGMQPAVDRSAAENAGGEVLDVADVVDLRPVEDHAHEESGDHADSTGEGGHDHGDLDPHFWLDPLLMADLVDGIADRLADLDPTHADDFRANAAAARRELEAVDQEYAEGLAGCQRDTVVVTHDAFAYLGKYGLHLEPILGLSPDAEPTAATLGRLKSLIRDEGVTTVFSEPLGSGRSASALARSAGVRSATLDPIEGATGEGDTVDYLASMRANLTALREANGC